MTAHRTDRSTRGGKRPGAGRLTGSTKLNSRNNVLSQRYNDAELAGITTRATECGYDNTNEYIRDTMIHGAMACKP